MGMRCWGRRSNSRWLSSGLKAFIKGTLWPLYQRLSRYSAAAAKMAPTVYTIPSSTTRKISVVETTSSLLKVFTLCLFFSRPLFCSVQKIQKKKTK